MMVFSLVSETALLKVSNDIMMLADSGEYTVLVLLDLSSAFDTVLLKQVFPLPWIAKIL